MQRTFKNFLFENLVSQMPDLMVWIRDFFTNGMDTTSLSVYADRLEEAGLQKAAELFRAFGGIWRDPKRKRGDWHGNLIGLFYDTFGYRPWQDNYELHDELSGSWFITNNTHSMKRHIVHAGQTSYRLQLNTGRWFRHVNEGDDRASVVSIRHVPTEDSERHYPARRITLRDYQPIPITEVPDDVLLFTFYKLLEKQISGSH